MVSGTTGANPQTEQVIVVEYVLTLPENEDEFQEQSTSAEFLKHELLERAHMAAQIIDLLDDHPAHTPETRAAFEEVQMAVGHLYQVVGAMRFKDDPV